MSLKDQIDSDIDIFFNSDDFAVESQYQAAGQTETVTVRAIWEFAPEAGSGSGMSLDSQYSAGPSDYAEVLIPAADLAAKPQYRDQITYPGDDTPYFVQQPRYEHGAWRIPVNRDQRGTFRG